MQAPRIAPLSALAIVLVAAALAGCGVKGELERPSAEKSESTEPRVAAQSESARPERKVFYETSRVVGVSRNLQKEMAPPMPPKKWEKKEAEPSRSPRALAPRPHERQPDPDKAFFLDWLL